MTSGRLRPAILVAMAGLAAIAAALWNLRAAGEGVATSVVSIDGTPATVFRPADGSRGPVVVIAHGFAGSQQLMQSFALAFARNGYTAVTFDFAGHGRNPRPLGGSISREDGATRRLVDEVARVADLRRPARRRPAGRARPLHGVGHRDPLRAVPPGRGGHHRRVDVLAGRHGDEPAQPARRRRRLGGHAEDRGPAGDGARGRAGRRRGRASPTATWRRARRAARRSARMSSMSASCSARRACSPPSTGSTPSSASSAAGRRDWPRGGRGSSRCWRAPWRWPGRCRACCPS